VRYYLLDRIEEIRYGDYLTAVKCISLSDDIFDEHFPGHPIFPGCLIQEGLAQAAGTLFELSMTAAKKPPLCCILSIVNRMKFRAPAYPGDRLLYRATIVAQREESGVAAVSAEIDGAVCAEGELTFTFADMSNPLLEANRKILHENSMRTTRIIP
jgi:3-hydroxyacyl-[acyl-carrier-protein] dehydratase